MFTLITGLFAMMFIIAVHEWGHLIAARMCGVPVDKFSIGMGPALVAVRDKHGTVWQISPIPFGGYVQPDEEAMKAASPAGQIFIAAAGPLFSFLLCFVLLFLLVFIEMPETTSWFTRLTASIDWAATSTFGFMERTVRFVAMLFGGEVPVTNLAGPVGIVHITGQQAALGWQAYVQLLAMLSVSIGILNLLPIVPLDGGRIVVGLLRYVVGDTWSQRYAIIQAVPVAVLLLCLFVTITYNDVIRIFFE